MDDLDSLATRLGLLLTSQQWTITTAESCTGGGVAAAITSVAGSSQWFEQGFITYSNGAKQQHLSVEQSILDNYGAVSEPVVLAMAKGACQHAKADVAIAVSGIAGPGGGSPVKPVGTVWLGWASPNIGVVAKCYRFDGDRHEVRSQAVAVAIGELNTLLEKNTV